MKMPILCLASATISNTIITSIYNKVIAEVGISSKVINLLKTVFHLTFYISIFLLVELMKVVKIKYAAWIQFTATSTQRFYIQRFYH